MAWRKLFRKLLSRSPKRAKIAVMEAVFLSAQTQGYVHMYTHLCKWMCKRKGTGVHHPEVVWARISIQQSLTWRGFVATTVFCFRRQRCSRYLCAKNKGIFTMMVQCNYPFFIQVSHFTRLQFPACMFWLLTRTSGYVRSSGFDKTLNLDNTSSWTFLPVRFKCDTKQLVLDQ